MKKSQIEFATPAYHDVPVDGEGGPYNGNRSHLQFNLADLQAYLDGDVLTINMPVMLFQGFMFSEEFVKFFEAHQLDKRLLDEATDYMYGKMQVSQLAEMLSRRRIV